MKNTGKTLLFVGISTVIAAIVCIITAAIFEIVGNRQLFTIFLIVGSALGAISLILLIVRFVFFGIQEQPHVETHSNFQNKVKTVDVKPVQKTKEENLYEQYEGLYKQGLISKEDLDSKRKELLGK